LASLWLGSLEAARLISLEVARLISMVVVSPLGSGCWRDGLDYSGLDQFLKYR
jgi:hypothetical protein